MLLPISVPIPLILVALVLLYLLWTYTYWYRKGVPQNNPLKELSTLDFTLCRQNYLTLFDTTYKKNKDRSFQGVYQLFKPKLFLCHPELIKDVMLNKSRVFPDTGSQLDEDTDPIMAGDPFFQTGQKWKDARARFSTLGTPARLRALCPYLLDICGPMNEYIRNFRHESGRGDGTDVKELVNKFVTESLVAVLLGGKANSFSSSGSIFHEIGKAVFEDNIVQNLAMLMIIGAPHLAKLLKLRVIPKKTADLLTRLIKEEAIRRKQSGVVRDDLFDHLLKKTENETEEKAHQTIIKTIVTFYIEGFESSSLVSSFTLLNLAKNPDIQENLRQEICNRAPRGTKLTEEAVSNVPLLGNCILETMRVNPPITTLQRQVNDDFTLKAPTGEEVFLEKGSFVSIPICGLSKDERVFPNPDIFEPDRFNDTEQRRFFMGFGDGPRLCLGQRYAQLAMSVSVASIVRDFQIEISPKMKFPMKFLSHPFFLYPADGIWLRFVPL